MRELDQTGMMLGIGLLGVGAAAVGTLNLLHRGRQWVQIAALLLLASAAAGLARTSEGFPFAILAGVCLVCAAWRSDRLRAVFARPIVQGIVLLLLGPALTAWWVERIDAVSGPPMIDTSSLDDLSFNGDLQEATDVRAQSDLGVPVPLYSPGRPIDLAELRTNETRLLADWVKNYQVLRSEGINPQTNCHGWVFTGGRYWIHGKSVDAILTGNGYEATTKPRAGDVVIYRDRGIVKHSGIVRAAWDVSSILIESKWGTMGTYLHKPEAQSYAQSYTFYHTTRSDHRIRGLNGETLLDAPILGPRGMVGGG